jgi:hypothetical protein
MENSSQTSRLALAIFVAFILSLPAFLHADDKEQVTPAAVLDAGFAIQHLPRTETISALPYLTEYRQLDINQDLNFNEFDVKQLSAIIDELNGLNLTGLQIATRFRSAQKNQKESFPIVYDLDRDGYFSDQDVQSMTDLVNELQGGSTKGTNLVRDYQKRIFPRK